MRSTAHNPRTLGFGAGRNSEFAETMSSFFSRDVWIGDPEKYNYSELCRLSNPFGDSKKKPPSKFYSKDEKLPIFLAAIMGLQHAMAMAGGLVTPGLVIFRFTINFNDTEAQQYIISAALIACGICTIINITMMPLPFTRAIFGRQLYLGSGVLSVMGTSFTFLPIYEISIRQMVANGTDPYDAYGKMLGTSMVCGCFEIFLSILPVKVLQKLFPPIVASVTVILLGVALTGTGMKYWGGGAVCAEMIWKEHAQVADSVGFDLPVFPLPSSTCQNGDVRLGYGSPEFIGLGFSVLTFLVFIELFGSTFLKNCNVVFALLFGYMVAGISDYQGDPYVDTSKITDADFITFLWKETFKLGFYGPAVVPLLIGYLVVTVETVGDITATYEVSNLDVKSKDFDESMQGALLSDSVCSILSNLFTSMPNTTFSGNNGVIALTKCASRRAGYAAGCWLIFLGVFSKVAGVFTSIPDCVLGGMNIFLFANVMVSGISLACDLDIHSRRVKFILGMSLAVGVGVSVWPFAFLDMRGSGYTANFWRCEDCSTNLQGIRNGVSIFLSTGFCIGTIIALLLNLILPEDPPSEDDSLVTDETNEKLPDMDLVFEKKQIVDDTYNDGSASVSDDLEEIEA